MSNPQPIDPGPAQQDMITDEVDHAVVADAVWTAMERAIAASTERDYAAVNIPHLLRSMKETHGSMRAVFTASEQIETNKKEPTGRWADMLILSRAQFDAVFVGLLLAHNNQEWGPKYYKACWATEAQRHVYALRRFRNTPTGRNLRNRNIYKLKLRARACQVTTKEWIATLAEIRGTPLRFGATLQDRIKPLPTPGQIVQRNLLVGGAYADLASVLWQQWKFLCDAPHAGLSSIVLRHALRSEQFGKLGELVREKMIYQEVVARSLIPSFVAIMTLVTVLATRHKENAELMAEVTKAWGHLEKGTMEGGIVWDNWARHALGVLSV